MRTFVVLAASLVATVLVGQSAGGRLPVSRSDPEFGGHLQGASPHEYPFLASIQIYGNSQWRHGCSGTIVGNTAVLTTGHCATFCNDNYCRIVVGVHDLSKEESSQQFYFENCFSVHPSFDRSDVNFDYGIIHTKDPIELKKGKVEIYQLPASSSKVTVSGGTCVSPGWDVYAPAGLQKVNVVMQSYQSCEEVYGSVFKETMICGKDAVIQLQLVDIGGPVICDGMMRGLGSWGLPPSGRLDFPAVFSNVVMELNWIKSQTNASCELMK